MIGLRILSLSKASPGLRDESTCRLAILRGSRVRVSRPQLSREQIWKGRSRSRGLTSLYDVVGVLAIPVGYSFFLGKSVNPLYI